MTYVRHQAKAESRRRVRRQEAARREAERKATEAAFPNVCPIHGTRYREACGACHDEQKS